MSRTAEESFSAALLVGQDTKRVLAELLGYEEARIEALRKDGVIG